MHVNYLFFNLQYVQSTWNDFEMKLIGVVNEIVPLSEFKNNIIMKSPSQLIRRKLNLRKR